MCSAPAHTRWSSRRVPPQGRRLRPPAEGARLSQEEAAPCGCPVKPQAAGGPRAGQHAGGGRAQRACGGPGAPALRGGASSGARPGGSQDLAVEATRAAVHVSKPHGTWWLARVGLVPCGRTPEPRGSSCQRGWCWGLPGGAPSPPCGPPGRRQRAAVSAPGRPLRGPHTETTEAMLTSKTFRPHLERDV